MSKILAKKTFNFIVDGARQSFHFFRQNTRLFEKNRASFRSLLGILYYSVSNIKLYCITQLVISNFKKEISPI